jgi:hydroxymethylbilane synthase
MLNGGCQAPVAAYAEIHHATLTLRALVANRNGTRILRAQHTENMKHAEMIGERVASEVIQQGAEKILKEFTSHE